MSQDKNEALEELEAPVQELSAAETGDVQGGGHVRVFDGAKVTSEPEEEAAVRHKFFAIVDRTN